MRVPLTYNIRSLVQRKGTTIMTAVGIARKRVQHYESLCVCRHGGQHYRHKRDRQRERGSCHVSARCKQPPVCKLVFCHECLP